MKILTGLAGEIGKMVGQLTISSQEKKELETRVTQIVCRYAEELTERQAAIVGREASGNWLQRSWRPLVMLSFAAVVLAGTFVEIPYLTEDSRFWNLIEIGLGGYVVGRSLEGMQQLFGKRRSHGKV